MFTRGGYLYKMFKKMTSQMLTNSMQINNLYLNFLNTVDYSNQTVILHNKDDIKYFIIQLTKKLKWASH